MKKKLADKIGKVFIKLCCPHFYWHKESPLEFGSYSRGVIVCNNCGKKKLIEELRDYEILVAQWRYKEYFQGEK